MKVLPEEFFEGEERRGRFEREASLLANLNHPGIAILYSFEEIAFRPSSSSRHVLVMELLEGEHLARGFLPARCHSKGRFPSPARPLRRWRRRTRRGSSIGT